MPWIRIWTSMASCDIVARTTAWARQCPLMSIRKMDLSISWSLSGRSVRNQRDTLSSYRRRILPGLNRSAGEENLCRVRRSYLMDIVWSFLRKLLGQHFILVLYPLSCPYTQWDMLYSLVGLYDMLECVCAGYSIKSWLEGCDGENLNHFDVLWYKSLKLKRNFNCIQCFHYSVLDLVDPLCHLDFSTKSNVYRNVKPVFHHPPSTS